jgi:hypothetical protein
VGARGKRGKPFAPHESCLWPSRAMTRTYSPIFWRTGDCRRLVLRPCLSQGSCITKSFFSVSRGVRTRDLTVISRCALPAELGINLVGIQKENHTFSKDPSKLTAAPPVHMRVLGPKNLSALRHMYSTRWVPVRPPPLVLFFRYGMIHDSQKKTKHFSSFLFQFFF